MTSDEEAQAWRNAEYRRLKAESDALLAEADRALAERKSLDENDPFQWSDNILRFAQKPPPEAPRKYTDWVIDRLITGVREETRAQLGALREEISGDLDELQRYVGDELSSLLTTTFDHVADRFIEIETTVRNLQIPQTKAIESDITELKSETAVLRTGFDALKVTVEALAYEVGALRDDVAAVERSGKVVSLKALPG